MKSLVAAQIVDWAFSDGSDEGLHRVLQDILLSLTVDRWCRYLPFLKKPLFRVTKFLCTHSCLFRHRIVKIKPAGVVAKAMPW